MFVLQLSRLRKKGLSEEALKERAASLLAENEETMFDYLSFIRLLGDFSGVPRHLKYKQKDYRDFLLRLAEYLKDFFFRANPFADADKVFIVYLLFFFISLYIYIYVYVYVYMFI